MYAWKLTVYRDLVQSKVIPVYDSKWRSHTHAEIEAEVKLEIHLMHTYNTCNMFVLTNLLINKGGKL